MNTWDESSLFRLSYALLRRFGVVTLDPPDDTAFHALIAREGLLRDRPVGPALAMLRERLIDMFGPTA